MQTKVMTKKLSDRGIAISEDPMIGIFLLASLFE